MTIRTLAIVALLAGTAGAQSLWNPDRPAPSMFSDTTARGIGDILTIVIDERQTVANDESTSFSKDSSLDAALTNFDVFPRFFEPLPSASGSASKSFDGSAQVDKTGRFETKISVVVIDVMPNGNMLVEGTRRIAVDGDRRIIRITGQVRPYDVTRSNTVKSEYVANASFAIEGTGPSSRAVNRGWFSRFLDVIWPF
ncbi:MAG: flagellar basal body L-ring protein FlgH [Planctomycetota bacterium]